MGNASGIKRYLIGSSPRIHCECLPFLLRFVLKAVIASSISFRSHTVVPGPNLKGAGSSPRLTSRQQVVGLIGSKPDDLLVVASSEI
jgi:hypothetical protein